MSVCQHRHFVRVERVLCRQHRTHDHTWPRLLLSSDKGKLDVSVFPELRESFNVRLGGVDCIVTCLCFAFVDCYMFIN